MNKDTMECKIARWLSTKTPTSEVKLIRDELRRLYRIEKATREGFEKMAAALGLELVP